MKTDKIIMYESAEAAQYVTGIEGWIDSNRHFFGKDERLARYSGCTHKTCECGKPMEKHWLKCEDCRHKAAVERYNALPFQGYNGEPVFTWDGDEFFFELESLTDYMEENDLAEIDLLHSIPIRYKKLSTEDICDDAHEDWEPEKELLEAIDKFNEVVSKLPAHSFTAGKIRTHFKLPKETGR